MATETAPIAAIRALLEYNWADEKRDYALHLVNGDHDDCGMDCPHIFLPMQKIAAWLDGIRDGQGTSRGRRHSPGWAGSGYGER